MIYNNRIMKDDFLKVENKSLPHLIVKKNLGKKVLLYLKISLRFI